MKCLFILLFSLYSITSFAQDSFPNKQVFGIKTYYGSIYAHAPSVLNTKGANPYGLEIEYSKQRINPTTYELCSCYPKTGFSLSYWNFNTSILGTGVALTHFIEPDYRISKKLQFKLRESFGLIFLSDPNTGTKNLENRSYSLPVNPYMVLGGGFSYSITSNLTTSVVGNFHHTSNGSYSFPNSGINWTSASVGLQYHPAGNDLPKFKRTNDKSWKKNKLIVETGLMLTAKQEYNARLMVQRKSLIGGYIQTTKQVARISGITAGVEVYHNQLGSSAKEIPSSTVASMHIGHMFLLGRVSLTQQIGLYLYNKTQFTDEYYTRWGFNYRVAKHLQLGLGMKAHSDYADFVDLRIGYLF